MISNIGEIMLRYMSHTRFGSKVKRYLFCNIPTQYMLSLEVPEHTGYDEVEKAHRGLMNIMTLLDTTTNLSTATRNEREDNFNRYIYRSLNLMM